MTWNYRIVRSFGGSLGIHEVYYDEEGPRTWTENPMTLYGETLDELKEDFMMMAQALLKPILREVEHDGRPQLEEEEDDDRVREVRDPGPGTGQAPETGSIPDVSPEGASARPLRQDHE